jgi:hypothetical protein
MWQFNLLPDGWPSLNLRRARQGTLFRATMNRVLELFTGLQLIMADVTTHWEICRLKAGLILGKLS